MKKLLLALLALLAPAAHAQIPTTPAVAAMVCANNTVVPTPTDGKFFYVQCDSSGKLITSGGGGGGSPGGSNTQVQYNNSGSFGGITGATTNGTTLTLVAPVLGTPASGVATNLTGTAAGLTAGNVTTNANLTGVITSVGNATSIASQTGIGTKFVVDTSPTLVTPTLGVALATSINGNTFTTGTGTLTLGSVTLNAGAGGTLGSNAFTSTAYLPLTGGTLTGNLTSTSGSANTENLTLNLGTLTANTKAIDITGTFNNSGVTFDAPLFMNITNTASATRSRLIDLQVGGASLFGVEINGTGSTADTAVIRLTRSIATPQSITIENIGNAFGIKSWLNLSGSQASTSVYLFNNSNAIKIALDTTPLGSGGIGLNLTSDTPLTWSTTTTGQTPDAYLARMGATATIGLNDGTTATVFQAYATVDVNSGAPTNFQRGIFDAGKKTANMLTVAADNGGTGVAMGLQFGVAKTTGGGVTLAANFDATNGNFNIVTTTDASSTATGALQVAGGGVVTKRFWIPGITASSGLQTAVLCQSSGGEMIADSVACLASSERAKIIFGSSDLGLDVVLALNTIDYQYKDTGNANFDNAPNHRMIRSGFRAEDAAKIDRRLVALDADGQVRTVVPDALVATLWHAVQQQQAQIEELKRQRN